MSLWVDGPSVWSVCDFPRMCVRKLHRALAVCVRCQLGRTAVWQRSDTNHTLNHANIPALQLFLIGLKQEVWIVVLVLLAQWETTATTWYRNIVWVVYLSDRCGSYTSSHVPYSSRICVRVDAAPSGGSPSLTFPTTCSRVPSPFSQCVTSYLSQSVSCDLGVKHMPLGSCIVQRKGDSLGYSECELGWAGLS